MLKKYIEHTASIDNSVRFTGCGNVIIGSMTTIEPNVIINLGESGSARLEIGSRVKIKSGVVIRCYNSSIFIGNRCSIGEYSILSGHGGINVCDEVIIASHCVVNAAEHIFESDAPIRFQGEKATGIIISRNSWVGAHASILDGVVIGEKCVIGAGSVVTKDMPSGYVCYGMPCKPKRLV